MKVTGELEHQEEKDHIILFSITESYHFRKQWLGKPAVSEQPVFMPSVTDDVCKSQPLALSFLPTEYKRRALKSFV